MILNTGDVPNIFPADEKADIIDKMQIVARNAVSFQFSKYMYKLCSNSKYKEDIYFRKMCSVRKITFAS